MLKKGDIETHIYGYLGLALNLVYGDDAKSWNIPENSLELLKGLCLDSNISLDRFSDEKKLSDLEKQELKEELGEVLEMFQHPERSFKNLNLSPDVFDEVKYALALKLSELIKSYMKNKAPDDVIWKKAVDTKLKNLYLEIPTLVIIKPDYEQAVIHAFQMLVSIFYAAYFCAKNYKSIADFSKEYAKGNYLIAAIPLLSLVYITHRISTRVGFRNIPEHAANCRASARNFFHCVRTSRHEHVIHAKKPPELKKPNEPEVCAEPQSGPQKPKMA